MANKKKGETQSTLFDVPAIAQVAVDKSKKKVTTVAEIDAHSIGLNAIYEGRSHKYRDFGDYIRSRKSNT